MGGYTLVEAELQLLDAAASNGPYDYYHLLSGSDLPLASQEFIHQFFDCHQGKEFLTFSEAGGYDKIYQRVKFHYHQSKWTMRYANHPFKQLRIRLFRKCDITYQKYLGLDYWKKINGDKVLKYGSQWFSITDDLVHYVLSKRDWIKQSFQYSYLCDELFLHTLVYHSPFYERVYIKQPVQDIPNELQGNLRYINWWDGTPYTWSISSERDCQQLALGIRLGHLFARKFDLSKEEIQQLKDVRVDESTETTNCSRIS